MNRRVLYRSVDDRILGGVAGGMADYFDLDPSIVRVLWIVAVPVTAGLALLAYIVMMIVVPEQTDVAPPSSPWQPGGEPVRPNSYNPGAYAANYAPPPSTSGSDPGAGGAMNTPDETPGGPQTEDPVDATQSWTATDAQGGVGATPRSGFVPGAGQTSPYPPGSREDRRWQRRRRRENRWQERQERWRGHVDQWDSSGDRWERRHSSSGPIVWGILLIMVGSVLLLQRFDPSFNLARTWPFLTIGFGALLVVLSVIRGVGSR